MNQKKRTYLCKIPSNLNSTGFKIVPIRDCDKELIRIWRNEQIIHLRQSEPISIEEQERYFSIIVDKLFYQEKPNQLLFSYLDEKNTCIGYGGLVHIDWNNLNAEISFLLDTRISIKDFELHWKIYLSLIEKVALAIKLHKIYIFAFDVRPYLYPIIEDSGFNLEAILKDQYLHQKKYYDAKIFTKIF